MGEQQTFTLPAGTVCHRNGIPFRLKHATQIECHPGVWPLIKGEPPEAEEGCVARKPQTPSLGGAMQALEKNCATQRQAERLLAALLSPEVMAVRPEAEAATPPEPSFSRTEPCLLAERRAEPESLPACFRTSGQSQADCLSTEQLLGGLS